MKEIFRFVLPILLVFITKLSEGQILRASTINIAAGKPINATSTCGVGLSEVEVYCKLASVPGKFAIGGLKCDRCDPTIYRNNRDIRFAVDGSEKWWQSPPLSRGLDYQKVNITIDLQQEYQVAYVVIKAGNAPRPGIWSLLRSVDGGRTFTPWQHFATSPSECRQYFGIESSLPVTQDNGVKCSTEYSSIPPFENGEIHISLAKGRPGAANFSYSPVLQEWTRATHIRLQLIKVKTLLTDLLPLANEDPAVTRRYFYSIKDISVGAICMCNGHAEKCEETQRGGRSEFVCQCRHNTCGSRCERCCPFFVQKSWAPGKPCEACNCHQHSSECRYDSGVAAAKKSLDLNNKYEGGGVCIKCQHNTAGINCEQCKEGYYNPTGVPKTAIDACRRCNCDSRYASGRCYPGTGDCECISANYGGPRCDRCNEGYYGFPDCKPCDCNPTGTTGRVCGPTGKQCPCKPNFAGSKCDRCADGYYGYPECRSCNCDSLGAVSKTCDPSNGQCTCTRYFSGRQCNQCQRGFYRFPECKACDCDSEGTARDICDPIYGRCICLPNFTGDRCKKCNTGFNNFPECTSCGCSSEGALSQSCDQSGQCKCKENYFGPKCTICRYGYYDYPRCIKCACDVRGSQHSICDLRTGQCSCKGSFRGLNCNQCRSGYYGFPDCKACQCNPAGIKPIPGRPFGDCSYSNNGQCDCKDNVQGLECTECKTGFYNLRSDNPKGCDSCYCDRAGVASGLANCDQRTGQCTCKQHVTGNRCNACKVGYFGLEEKREFGCAGCNCDVGGSYDQVCDAKTGQCKCRPNIEGLDCSRPKRIHYFPDFHHIKAEVEEGCVPSPSDPSIPGRNFQSDPQNQGDQGVDCKPIRFSFDDKLYPGYSWKGYVGFSDLQKTIKVRINVPKTGRYHVVFDYVLDQKDAVNGQIELMPRNQGSTQSSGVTFPSTQVGSTFTNGYAVAGENGKPTQFMLTKGTWDLTFTTTPSKLLLDSVSVVPQEYYLAGILQRKVNNPCIVNNRDPLCVQYSYLNTIRPDFATVEMEKGYIITREHGKQQTHVFDDKQVLDQLDFNEMAYLDRTQTRVTEDINIVKPGDYVLVMQYYHPSDNVKTLKVYFRSRRSQQRGTFYLHNCPFKFGCRQVALDENRRLRIFKADRIERRVITLLVDSDTSVAVDSITAIPLEKWHLDYVVPRPLCTTKDNKCISTSYPSPKGSVQFDANPNGSKPPPNVLDPSNKLQFVKGPSTVDLLGPIPKPGKYAILVHYYQPNHASFISRASVTSDRALPGQVQFDRCPNVEGCRTIIQSYDRTNLFDLGRTSAAVQLSIPQDKSLWIDYVVLIPEGEYNQEAVEANPVSFSKDFLKDCAQNGYFIKLSSLWPGTCTKPVFSLTAAYNDGSLPCDCDPKGSQSTECRTFGGQCPCKLNVIGRQCNKCKTGYYGFPNCLKCQCVFCNEITGACDCPPNTVGPNCGQCLKGTYGFDPIRGCQDCKCDISGVQGSDVSCDPITGRCPCKPSRTGLRCNQCAAGRFGYPYCNKCDCDSRGVLNDICDARGTCLCKPGVVGARCDKCVTGHYNLDSSNPNGCTPCWCSGLSKVCSSAKLTRIRIRNMQGWKIENTAAPVVSVGPNEISVAVANKRTNDDKPIYWIAPKEYLGNKVYSYGGHITYSVRYKVPVEVAKPVLTTRPDAILVGKNGLTLTYREELKIQPNQVFNIKLHLREKYWSVGNRSSISREELMSVLVGVESLKLRASFSTSVADTSLSDVYMGSATSIPGQPFDAREVEQCVCPAKADASSCELCGNGYTRGADNKTCVPCQCNGHSKECDPETGACYKCLHNTTGDRCQSCIKGFYGDATRGTPRDCKVCTCPLGISSNSFATECEVNDQRQLICKCKKGYTGPRCAQCAEGYYGDPTIPGKYCKPCECNGNIDPQVPGSCDPFTGECTKCINKADGDNCERCRDGYYGDAIVAKNCQKCKCNACGTVTTLCDHSTGACQCKDNVEGPTCNQCKGNTWNFDSCLGCEDCNCANASLGQSCDVKTGQCLCKPGAIGRKCDRCQAGFWNYGDNGCQVCNCPKDKDNLWGFCDVNTGQCCKPGGNCTICPPNYILTQTGCEYCSECVGRLLETATGLDKNITRILDYLKKGAAGVIAEAKLKDLNDTVNKLIPPTNKYTDTMSIVSNNVGVTTSNRTAVPLPFARYPFSRQSRGSDTSNNHPDAELKTSTYTSSPNGPDTALSLAGNTKSYITIRNANFNTKRSMSILLWVKHQGVIGPVLDFGYGKFRIWLVETDGTFDINFETASGPNLFKLLKTEANKWHHIGLSYEQDTGMAQLYLNEKLVKQGNVGTSGLEMESNEVRLGALDNNVEAFTGAVSCLQIFDESLNVQQIGVLKTACQPGFVQPPLPSSKTLIRRSKDTARKADNMQDKVTMVKKDAIDSTMKASQAKTDALVLEDDIRDALNKSRNIINLAGGIADTLKSGSANQTLLLQQAEEILKELQDRDFTSLNNTVNKELEMIATMAETAKMLLNDTKGLHDQASQARKMIDKLKKEFMALLDISLKILDNATMGEKWNEKSKTYDYMTQIMQAKAKRDVMDKTLMVVEDMLRKTADSVMNATQSFESFNGNFARLDDLIRQVYDRFKNLTMLIDEIEPLAGRAANHSEVLRKQAKVLKDLLEDTKQFSEKALNASKAYSNIAAKLNEALKIAKQAEGNATQAQNKAKDVSDNAKLANEESKKILDSANTAKKRVDDDLQNLLDDLKDRIAKLKKKIAGAENELMMVNTTLKDIDNYGDMGARAKIAEKNATDSKMVADDAYGIAKKIEDSLPQLEQLKKDIAEANKNISETEKEVMDAVKNSVKLKERIKVIRTKQKQIQDDLKTEVLDVIRDIENMLAETRGQLKSFDQVMSFTGETYTNPLPPPIARGPSTFKDIALYIKPRVLNGLVMYLGGVTNNKRLRRQTQQSCNIDFIAIELKDNKVNVVMCISRTLATLDSGNVPLKPFKDSDTTNIIVKPGSVSADPYYSVHFNLDGGTATLQIEEYINNRDPVKTYPPTTYKFKKINPVFNVIKSNSHLLFGGVPDGIQIPSQVSRVNFQGSVDGVKVDYVPVGLWDSEKLVKPKYFYKREAFVKGQDGKEKQYQFFGDSYIKRTSNDAVREFSVGFQTMQSAGVLVSIVKTPSLFILVDVYQSKLRFAYNMGYGNVTLLSDRIVDDGKKHTVEYSEDQFNPEQFTLKLDNKFMANGKNFYPDSALDDFAFIKTIDAKSKYIGGAEKYPALIPEIMKASDFRNFKGCIYSVFNKFGTSGINVGTRPSCSESPSRYVTMNGDDSYLQHEPLDLDTRSPTTISISFMTTSATGVILHQAHESADDLLTVGLENGNVVLKANPGGKLVTLTTDETYNDNKWHFVKIDKEGPSIALYVDNEEKNGKFEGNQRIQTTKDLYIGGISKDYASKMPNAPTKMMTLKGATFRDFHINGKPISFREGYKKAYKVDFNDEELPESKVTDLIIPVLPTPRPQETPSKTPTTSMQKQESTTRMTTTEMPLTTMSTTEMPTTEMPTTKMPTTKMPTTEMPITTLKTTTKPVPTTPPFCSSVGPVQRDDAVKDYGSGMYTYAKYVNIRKNDVLKKVAGDRTKIQLKFRAVNPDGILFYSAAGDADFVTCYMVDGRIKCRFNTGAGLTDLESSKKYNDGKWHSMLFNRKRQVGNLRIDGVKEATATSKGSASNIDGLKDFYIGGVPKGFVPKRVEEVQAQSSFPGCIREFNVSSKTVGEPDAMEGVIGCMNTNMESGVHFDNGFVVVDETFTVGIKKTIMLEIKPEVDTAVIFSVISKGDFIILEMVKGVLIFRMENGNGPIEVRYTPSVDNELCDGRWHRIRIVKNGKTASLKVDDNDEVTEVGKGSLSNANIYDPFYLGGVEDGFTHKAHDTTARFKGCMRSLVVEDTKSPPNPIYRPTRKSGSVYVGGCPVPPAPEP